MQCEINSKQEGIRRLNHQIQAQTNDLKEYKEHKNKLHKRVRELQYQVEKYEKKKEDAKLFTQRPNTRVTSTDITETTTPTRAASNRRLVCFCTVHF
jgi:phage shock protein A